MPRAVSSRATWPTSTFTSTQRKSPASPWLSRSRSAMSAEVLPVWRGACSTKYCLARISLKSSSTSTRSRGGMGVVVVQAHRTRGVEEAHGRIMARAAPRSAFGGTGTGYNRAPSTTPIGATPGMTFVVTEQCIKCKYTDCVEVCPVDCFHEGPNMLVIDPDECIDCTLCEPECPGGGDPVRRRSHRGPAAPFLELNDGAVPDLAGAHREEGRPGGRRGLGVGGGQAPASGTLTGSPARPFRAAFPLVPVGACAGPTTRRGQR